MISVPTLILVTAATARRSLMARTLGWRPFIGLILYTEDGALPADGENSTLLT